MTAACDARGRRIWPWPLAVAALAAARDGFVAGWSVGVVLPAAVAALVWLWAKRAGTHYGTAVATGALFALLPGHAEWTRGTAVAWMEALGTTVLLLSSYALMGASRASPDRTAIDGPGGFTVSIALGTFAMSAGTWAITGRAVPPLSLGAALLVGHAVAGAVACRSSRHDA